VTTPEFFAINTPKKMAPKPKTPSKASTTTALEDFMAANSIAELSDLASLDDATVKAAIDDASPCLSLGERAKVMGAMKTGRTQQADGGGGGLLELLKDRLGVNSDGSSSGGSSEASSLASRENSTRSHRRRRRGRGHGRSKQAKEIASVMQTAEMELTDPLPLIREACTSKNVEYPDDWPLRGKASSRVAPEFLPQVYGKHRRARIYAEQWAAKKYQTNTPVGRTMVRYGIMLDTYLMYDQPRGGTLITNNCMVEILCRDMYGLVKAFRDVVTAADAKPDNKGRSKIRYKCRDEYDVAALDSADICCTHADENLAKSIKIETATEKAFAGGAEHE